ncbi:MAG TPA: pirin family protein [Myxococcota bacterium]|nr:pirin family protein [Myxococcota bacterium]
MSELEHTDPECARAAEAGLELEIHARPRDLGGGVHVSRLLPAAARRMVGPWIFFDHLGPVAFPPGGGLDVRPHPHIGLATVTYAFEGEILHRDSLGNEQPIRPGALNWMTAGRGIVHSERTPPALRAAGPRMHFLQLWVALPKQHEETEPSFQHHPAESIPQLEIGGARVRVIAGSAFGVTSPARVLSPLFYAEALLPARGALELPVEHPERGLYVVEGAVRCGGKEHSVGTMLVWKRAVTARVIAQAPARVVVLGGAPLDGPRHVFWNFVSSSEERIERAKQDWRNGRFPKVAGDDEEFIPLPT